MTNIKNHNKWIISLILPPIWSAIVSLVEIFKNKKWNRIVPFLFAYCLIIVYSIQSYDNRIRFLNILKMNETSSILDDHILSWIIYSIKQYCDIGCTLFFALYAFLCLLLYYEVYRILYNKFNAVIALMIILTISVKNLYDLNYSTLSIVFLLYCMLRFSRDCLKYLFSIIGCYIIHPVALIVLLFSTPLYYLLKNNKFKLVYLYVCVLIFICSTLFVINNQFNGIGIEMIDAYIDKGNSYLSQDNFWADKSNLEMSLSLKAFSFFEGFLNLFFGVMTIFTVKKKLLPPMLSAMIISSSILYFATINTVTFNERFCSAIFIYGMTVFPLFAKVGFKWISYRKIACLCVFMYFSSLYFHPLVQTLIFGPKGFPEEISIRKYYIPSIILLDVNDFGLSDNYLKKEMK